MPPLGQTALVLRVPEADSALTCVASVHLRLVRADLPAHVTILYPWLPAHEVDTDELSRCAGLVAPLTTLDVTFNEVHARPGLIFLEPDPGEPVQRLCEATQRCWPSLLPYEGKYADSPPHVTLALGTTSTEEEARIRALVDPLLPLRTRFDELLLMAFGEQGWSEIHRFPYGSEGGG